MQYGLSGVDRDGNMFEHSAVVDAQTGTGRDPFLIPGVTKMQVYRAKPIAAHLDLLWEVCDDAIVICHKREFDWVMLEAEFRRNDRAPPKPFRVECTLRLSRTDIGLPGPHTLGALCARFRIPLLMAHNALHDARATFRLYIILLNLYPRAFHRTIWRVNSVYWAPVPWATALRCVPMRTETTNHLAKFQYTRT